MEGKPEDEGPYPDITDEQWEQIKAMTEKENAPDAQRQIISSAVGIDTTEKIDTSLRDTLAEKLRDGTNWGGPVDDWYWAADMAIELCNEALAQERDDAKKGHFLCSQLWIEAAEEVDTQKARAEKAEAELAEARARIEELEENTPAQKEAANLVLFGPKAKPIHAPPLKPKSD